MKPRRNTDKSPSLHPATPAVTWAPSSSRSFRRARKCRSWWKSSYDGRQVLFGLKFPRDKSENIAIWFYDIMIWWYYVMLWYYDIICYYMLLHDITWYYMWCVRDAWECRNHVVQTVQRTAPARQHHPIWAPLRCTPGCQAMRVDPLAGHWAHGKIRG